tara:strand:- start:1573 stop:2415 length:843 start_codon:yes stop_codon:yes gene_type:complete
MKIVVTGGQGQLALALKRRNKNHQLLAPDRKTLDISLPSEVEKFFQEEQPDVVINCGAWTNVDACETNPKKALAVNGEAVGTIAKISEIFETQLVQISTDYVFDGKKKTPYLETDKPNPLSVYGESKLLGEHLAGDRSLIVRTSWLMSANEGNTLQTILGLLSKPGELKFVDDQIGCPTFAEDLADQIFNLIEARINGIFHVTNADSVSWFEFAKEVARETGNDPTRIIPISTSELNPQRPAKRPSNSVLSNQALSQNGFLPLRSHTFSLIDTLKELGLR